MKVNIGNYINWIGPYQIAEVLCWWAKDVPDEHGLLDKPEWVHDFGTWLAETKTGEDSWLTRFCNWIHSKRNRKVKIRIDKYDTWNMDSTLALLILPMLKQLKETKHGSQLVDMEDVPEHMRYTTTEDWDAQSTFDFYNLPNSQNIQCDLHDRWDWVMDEMIWTFEQLNDPNGDSQFYDHSAMDKTLPLSKQLQKMKVDYLGLNAYNDRIDNGLKLFGKYYRGLWD
jgi:hypothetical protein